MATVHFLRSILLPEGYLVRLPPSRLEIVVWKAAAAALSLRPWDKKYQVLGKRPKYEACERSSLCHLKKKEKENLELRKNI